MRCGELARRWRIALALLLITVIAAVFRFALLDGIPPGFHYDEAFEALEAWRVMTQPDYRPIFFPGNFGVEPAFIYLTSVAFALFGSTPLVMRSVAAVVGTLSVLALYGLGRELALGDDRFPKAAAWLAALALAVMRWHVFFSRVGIEPILVPLCLILILWTFWRAWRTGSTLAWLALGIVTGLSLYVYPSARLLPIVALLLAGLALVMHRRTGAQASETPPQAAPGLLPGLGLAGLAAVLVAAPMLWNWLQHPDQLLLRSTQIAVLPGGATSGGPLQNLVAALGMFSLKGDADPRSNIPGMPVLDPVITLPFLAGLASICWRWKRPIFGGLLLAGLVMLIPTVLSDYAPHFRRAVGITPVVALCIGLGLAAMLGRGHEKAPEDAYVPQRVRESGLPPGDLGAAMERFRRLGRVLVVVLIVIGSAVYSAAAYYGVWGRSNGTYYAYDEGLWEIGRYVEKLPADEPVFLSPRPESDMTLAFAWREGRPVRRFDGRHAFVAGGAPRPTTYIIIGYEDFRGAPLLRSLYPEASQVATFTDRAGRLYASAYRVADPTRVARQPQAPVEARWPGITLLGYDIDNLEFAPGSRIYLQLWWRADVAAPGDWTVFTHVLGPAKSDGNTVWAGIDAQPGLGSAATRTWAEGDLILDEYQIMLPSPMPPGPYQIEVGLYDPRAGSRRAVMTQPTGQDHLILGTVQVR